MFCFLAVAAVAYFITWRFLWWITSLILGSINDAGRKPKETNPWAGEYEIVREVVLVGGYPYRHIRKVREEGDTDYERHLLAPLTRACPHSLLLPTCIGFAVQPSRESFFTAFFTGFDFNGPCKVVSARWMYCNYVRGNDWKKLQGTVTDDELHEILLARANEVERSLIQF